METANFEPLFPFIIILLVYVITNLRKAMAKSKNEEIKKKNKDLLKDLHKFKVNEVKKKPRPLHTPPLPVQTISNQKVEIHKDSRQTLHKKNIELTKNKRIQQLVSNLSAKKNLIYFSEILHRKDFF